MRRYAAVALAMAAVVSACSDSGGNAEADGEGWTVLHYSMADTDLESFMVADLNEMGSVGSGGGLRLRAMFDRSPEYSRANALGLGDWSGAKVIDVGHNTGTEVADLGNVDMAKASTLATFIADGIEAHPAAHYALVISDHGASWPGIGPDESSDDDVLDLAELTKGIGDGLDKAGVDKLDLLGFDACLMANYEVASAVAPLADRMVASQELEPGHGWDYTALQTVKDDGGATVDELGAALVDGFLAQAQDEGTDADVTLALLDLTKMERVDDAMDAFASSLSRDASKVAPAVGRAEATTLGFARSPDETEDAHLRDLGQLAKAIGADTSAASKSASALRAAIRDVVVKRVAGKATQGATGLSVYFPPTRDLGDDAYGEVDSATAWRNFLTKYYKAGDSIPKDEQPDFVDPNAAVEFDEDGVTLSGAFDDAATDNLTDATISYAMVGDDGTLTYFGEEFADLDEDGKPEASGFYDLTSLKMTDGEDSAYAYLTLDRGDDDSVYSIDVPMAYYASPDDEEYADVLLTLTLDADSGDVVDATYYVYNDDTGGYGELEPAEEGIVVPEVLQIDGDGDEVWQPTTDVGLWADLDSLDYEFEQVPSGTKLQLDLTVYDYGDNSDTVSAVVTVP